MTLTSVMSREEASRPSYDINLRVGREASRPSYDINLRVRKEGGL